MTKFQVDTIPTCHTMDGQTHTIGKAIRPLFANLVTYRDMGRTLHKYYTVVKKSMGDQRGTTVAKKTSNFNLREMWPSL